MAFSAKVFVALVAVIFVQGICARHARSTDATTSFQEMLDNAKAQLQAVTEEFNKVTGTANFEEMKTILETNTRDIETRAKNVLAELKRQYETHAPEVTDKATAAINEATNHLNATLEHVKAQTPGTLEEAAALRQRFAEAFKSTAETVFDEAGKVAKAAGDDASTWHTELTNLSRRFIDQTTQVLTSFHNEIQDAIKRTVA